MLSDPQLVERILSGEDSVTEFKPEGTSSRDIRKTLVAFANTVPEAGIAVLFIGIVNGKDIVGVRNADELQKTVRKICTEECYPEVVHVTRVLSHQGKHILTVMIGYSSRRPHFAGSAYVRVGSESVRATEQVYEDLISSRNDKARRILPFKGKEISVHCQWAVGLHKFGNLDQRKLGRAAFESHEFTARVAFCDAFCVQLTNLYSGETTSLPLSWLTIDWDVSNRRLKLRLIEETARSQARQ